MAERPLVFIAGPYTVPDPVENTGAAIDAGMALFESGEAVPLIPHLTLAMNLRNPRPADYWYALDLEQLAHCSAVLRLPGESAGADREVERARELGLPIFDDVDKVIRWAGAMGRDRRG